MKILIGTTNPSKVKRFSEMLSGCGVEFCTLNDIDVHEEPSECGSTPEDNAAIKAEFYGQFFDKVICNDSGLYFSELPLNDSMQPGLDIRTPCGCERLDDEAMISYYSKLINSLGGRVTAFYLDGIAVYNNGKISTFMEDIASARAHSFYMTDKPCEKRLEGWPLDSLSLNKQSFTYFAEAGNDVLDATEQIITDDYRVRVVDFLKSALGID